MDDSPIQGSERRVDDFSGQVILVGGSSAGVDRNVAEQLLQRGATVALHYRARDTQIKQLAEDVAPERVMAVQADLTDRASARQMVSDVITRSSRIDGLSSAPSAPDDETHDAGQLLLADQRTDHAALFLGPPSFRLSATTPLADHFRQGRM
jgi:NAD(P)-dependent dehydrogenase (short-subunit alcohol dehydrogenase family)